MVSSYALKRETFSLRQEQLALLQSDIDSDEWCIMIVEDRMLQHSEKKFSKCESLGTKIKTYKSNLYG